MRTSPLFEELESKKIAGRANARSSAFNRSRLRARNLQQTMQRTLNPVEGGPEVEHLAGTLRIGDRFLHTDNNNHVDVLYGDPGSVAR
jgi:hypothetical protein